MNFIKKALTAALMTLGMVTASPASSIQEIEKASFRIHQLDRGICSSTYIGKNSEGENLFISAAHCFANGDQGMNVRRQIFDEDMDILREEVFYIKLVYSFPEGDTAVFKMKEKLDLGIKAVDVADSVEANLYSTPGADVLVAGFPLAQSFTFTTGMMSGKTKEVSEELGVKTPLVKTTANVAPGSSGGSLYTKIGDEWKLIGTTVGMHMRFQFLTYFSTPESVHKAIKQANSSLPGLWDE